MMAESPCVTEGLFMSCSADLITPSSVTVNAVAATNLPVWKEVVDLEDSVRLPNLAR